MIPVTFYDPHTGLSLISQNEQIDVNQLDGDPIQSSFPTQVLDRNERLPSIVNQDAQRLAQASVNSHRLANDGVSSTPQPPQRQNGSMMIYVLGWGQ